MEKYREQSWEDVKRRVDSHFADKEAFLYGVLDFAVAFGIYRKGNFWIWLPEKKEPETVDPTYLREIRVFHEEGELCFRYQKEEWIGRFRQIQCDSQTEYSIEEHQKLWGKVTENKQTHSLYWSLLRSGRGTKIWIPFELDIGKKAGIAVKKIMRIPNPMEQELVYQTDIQMVGFCEWEGGNQV